MPIRTGIPRTQSPDIEGKPGNHPSLACMALQTKFARAPYGSKPGSSHPTSYLFRIHQKRMRSRSHVLVGLHSSAITRSTDQKIIASSTMSIQDHLLSYILGASMYDGRSPG